MTFEEINERAEELHRADMLDSDFCGMAYVVFTDGEICLTKAGRLFGQRGFHMQAGAVGGCPQYLRFPQRFGEYTCCLLDERSEAYNLRHEIAEAIRKQIAGMIKREREFETSFEENLREEITRDAD